MAGLLSGELDTLTVMESFVGELGTLIVRAFTHVRWSELVGEVRFYAEPQHSPNEPCVRVGCAHMLKALERTSPSNRRACSSALFRGHTHRINDDGEREYVPGRSAGGLSARLDRSPRTLDRHCQVLEAAGLLDVWQPPARDVPRDMRGVDYAYAIYEWRHELPAQIGALLVQWYGTAEQRKAATVSGRTSSSSPRAPAAPTSPPAERTTAGAAKTAGALLSRFPGPS